MKTVRTKETRKRKKSKRGNGGRRKKTRRKVKGNTRMEKREAKVEKDGTVWKKGWNTREEHFLHISSGKVAGAKMDRVELEVSMG